MKRRLTDEVLQAQGGHEADGVHNMCQQVALVLSVAATQTRSQLKAEAVWASSQVVVELKGQLDM